MISTSSSVGRRSSLTARINTPTAGATPIAGSVTLFSGTSDVSQVSYANPRLTAGGTERDTLDENKTIALNAKWNLHGVTVTGDVAYTKSKNDLFYTELDLFTNIPVFTQREIGRAHV